MSNRTEVISANTVEEAVWDAILKTINKFREQPYYFFTESDLHSYFYHCLYNSKLECVRNDGKRVCLIHREYPTNFRFRKRDLNNANCEVFALKGRKGDRGNYDFAVLNPEFVINEDVTIGDIVNKDVKLLEKRVSQNPDSVRSELLFAMEFKFVTRNSRQFWHEIAADTRKLQFAKEHQAKNAVNLVFTKLDDEKTYIPKIAKSVSDDESDVMTVFVSSYYDENSRKVTNKPTLSMAARQRGEFEKWLDVNAS
ncbi:hypothetical protein ACFL1X_05350 [Candidatus Hydrogenedentota bacterium]